jgi:hypothetical protein
MRIKKLSFFNHFFKFEFDDYTLVVPPFTLILFSTFGIVSVLLGLDFDVGSWNLGRLFLYPACLIK